jgi:hypothetical protein
MSKPIETHTTVLSLGALRPRVAMMAMALCAVAGCTAEVETARPTVVASATTDDSVVEVETVPAADITAYPHTEYDGRVVYYVNGRWYYPHGRRWYYYRKEPPALVRHRGYVEQASPAHRGYTPRPGEAVRVQ